MTKKYCFNFLLIILFAPFGLVAQTLQGKVVDEKSGQQIPFVSIGIVGTNEATITNENGDFVLKVTAYPAKLRFSHVSYLLSEITLSQKQDQFTVKLVPASISLKEVTVDPYKGIKLLKAALKKAKSTNNQSFYANAFYRQLTTVDSNAAQIYELFYDLRWHAKKVSGWIAKQSRFAESVSKSSYAINNQSFLTFIFSGVLLPEDHSKFVNLQSLDEFEITIDRFIEQANQNIAVVSCNFKNPKRKLFYGNSVYYIGTDDFKIYRLENEIHNMPTDFPTTMLKFPPVFTTTATFNGTTTPIPLLESIATKLTFGLKAGTQVNNIEVTSLLTVYKVDNSLNKQRYQVLDGKIKDKTLVESIKYDAEFWKDNPIVKQTALESSFIKMMESKSAFGTMINP